MAKLGEFRLAFLTACPRYEIRATPLPEVAAAEDLGPFGNGTHGYGQCLVETIPFAGMLFRPEEIHVGSPEWSRRLWHFRSDSPPALSTPHLSPKLIRFTPNIFND